MSDPTQSCPPAWSDRSANGVRVCGRPADSFNQCHSTLYSTSEHSYNRVCGRVIGYQFGHTDAFELRSHATIDQPYVDGVSFTHGNPRSHIWTLAAGLKEMMKVDAAVHVKVVRVPHLLLEIITSVNQDIMALITLQVYTPGVLRSHTRHR